MADFAGLLKKTIDAQANPTPQLRERVYARARETVERKLVETNVPEAVADAQRKALDDAVKAVEAEYLAVEQALLSMIIEPAEEEVTDVSTPVEKVIHAAPIERVEPREQDSRVEPSPAGAQQNVPAAEPLIFAYPVTARVERVLVTVETTEPLRREPPVAPQKTIVTRQEPAFETPISPAVRPQAASVVPAAEPVNMDDILAAERQYARQKSESEARSANAFTAQPQTGDFDIVSDIFVQAARRSERQAAKKRAIVVGGSIAALVLLVAVVLFTAWSFLSKGNHEETTDVPVAGSDADKEPSAEKLTQRLLADGSEVDAGPAEAAAIPGEGTSTAAATAAGPVDQPGEAVFYQARTDNAAEKIETGSVQWSLVKEPSTTGGPEELAVRGNVTIPDEKLSLRLTLRRNTDPSLPAAYLLEFIFIVPDGFEGQAIDNVHELTFKASEQSTGQPLAGTVAAKIDDDFFLFALSGARPFLDGNLQLMRQLGWMRLVVTDKNGRISELTFSKGPTGEDIFRQVIDQWLKQEDKPTVYDQNNAGQNGQPAPAAPAGTH
ncbi:hypothetical protein [Bartonella sp. LJL80]